MSNQIRDKQAIEKLAKRIAHDILSVNTDFRGNLLAMVGEEVRKYAQGFTALVIEKAADHYGVNNDL